MFSYDPADASNTLTPPQESQNVLLNSLHSPVTSTMIDEPYISDNFSDRLELLNNTTTSQQSNYTNYSSSQTLISGIDRFSDTAASTLIVDHMNYHLLPDEDMEISRSLTIAVASDFMQSSSLVKTDNDYEDVTVLKHNNSPVSNYANHHFEEVNIF